MPELPEVEPTRARIEQNVLGRRIVAVDHSDRYVCRPHPRRRDPGRTLNRYELAARTIAALET